MSFLTEICMDNFKFNFLSRGQLESLNLDRIFLPLFKILPCMQRFFGNLIFAIIVRIGCAEIILIYIPVFWIMGLMKALLSTTKQNDYRSLNSSSVKRRDYCHWCLADSASLCFKLQSRKPVCRRRI